MEGKLLSVKDLARRWQKDEGTIRRYVNEGTISPCKGVPGMMFHPEYIAKLEGIELERFSPLEKKKMEKELAELRKKVELQSNQLRKYTSLGVESLNLLSFVE